MISIISLLSKTKTLKISLTESIIIINKIQILNNLRHKSALSLFHINTCSLPKNIEELEYLSDKTKIDFHVIGISDLRILKNKCPINNINLKDYSYESYLTRPSTCGILLCISNHLS